MILDFLVSYLLGGYHTRATGRQYKTLNIYRAFSHTEATYHMSLSICKFVRCVIIIWGYCDVLEAITEEEAEPKLLDTSLNNTTYTSCCECRCQGTQKTSSTVQKLLSNDPRKFSNPLKFGLDHGQLTRWMKWRACDVEAKEGLENKLWCRWSNRRVGEWAVT